MLLFASPDTFVQAMIIWLSVDAHNIGLPTLIADLVSNSINTIACVINEATHSHPLGDPAL